MWEILEINHNTLWFSLTTSIVNSIKKVNLIRLKEAAMEDGKNKDNESVIHPIFARHETFHPRFGWLKKGFDKADEDDRVFSRDSAAVVLGVGKNMVKAIRYWCIAFKVVDEILLPQNTVGF